MTTSEDMNRVTGEELNSRMVFLKPSVERIANLQREQKSNTRQLAGVAIVCFVILCWVVTR